MAIQHNRLDRFINKHCQDINKKAVRLLVAQKRILIDGKLAKDVAQIVHHFSIISLDNKVLQHNKTIYIMLHKPVGVVCATVDDKHQTVIDLLKTNKSLYGSADNINIEDLHIVGRLDLNTSGLVLLTNDSRWSEKITSPSNKIAKYYTVTLKNKLSAEYIDAFAEGMYFSYENITTLPAKLAIISDHQAKVTLYEGRYHQIKRMFGRFQNQVVALHREAIGSLCLDVHLALGDSRLLSVAEVNGLVINKPATIN